jgi:hypothetical protein
MSSNAEVILEELKENKLYFENALNYFKEKNYNLNQEISFKLIEEILNSNSFYWIELVGYLLRKNATPNEYFFNILCKVIEKTNRGDFWLNEDLVQLGFEKPDIGLEIYRKAREINNSLLLSSCRWIVGGVGKKDFKLIYTHVLDCLKSSSPELRVLAITWIRISFAHGITPNCKNKIFSLLDNSQMDPEQKVKLELLNTYITFYSYAKGRCFRGIIALLNENLDLMRTTAKLLFHRDLSKQHYDTLVKKLAETDDKDIIESVLKSIGKRGDAESIENYLNIIEKILKNDSYFQLKSYPLDDALNKMGAIDLNACLGRVNSWLKSSNTNIQYACPTIAVEFGRNNLDKLVQSLNLMMDQDMRTFAFETASILLSEIYEQSCEGKNLSQPDQDAVNNLLEKLKAIAQTQGLDSKRISKKEQSIIFKCCILIEAIGLHQNIDYNIIRHNLECLPSIKDFMGEKWLKEMETKQDGTHPLLALLSEKLLDVEELERKLKETEQLSGIAKKIELYHINDVVRTRGVLLYLENAIDCIKGSPSLRTVRASLRLEEHFWTIVSEIDVMSRLIKSPFKLEKSPKIEVREAEKIKNKNPDFLVSMTNTDVYIEVICPETFGPLRYFHVATVPNKVRAKITDEIKKHFKGMLNPKPVIIIVDFGNSTIHYSDIQDYVDGELQYMLTFDQETREPIGFFTQRGIPMTKMDEGTNIIIGIIAYTRVLGTDGKIHLKGRKFATAKSCNVTLEKIADWLLG